MRLPVRPLLLASLAILVAMGAPRPITAAGMERGADAVPVAVAAEISGDTARTRLTFTLSKPVSPRAFLMERPDRVIVDLPEVSFHLPAEASRHRAGLITSYRYGLFAPGRSRIVIDLAQPALVSNVEVAPGPSDGVSVLSIELSRSDRDAFRRAAAADSPGARASAEITASTQPSADRRPLIMVDAGHGGIDPGAIAASGAFEKDIVLGFAQSLAERLRKSGRYRVEMTRHGDVFVPLGERSRMARAAEADLFVSIHADSIPAAPSIHGGTIYTGSERATDAESESLADRENKADAAAGLDSNDGLTEVSDILHDLTVRETRTFSHRFAKKLLGNLGPVMKMSPKPQREAGFKVLRSPDVPSVLVELGYLSNKADLDHLVSTEWRERTTVAMASAIDSYFAARLARTDLTAAAPAAVSP